MAFDFTSYNDNVTYLSDAFISDTDSSDLDSDRTITDNEMDESFLDNAVGDSVSAEESDSDDNFSFNIFVNRQFFLTTKKIEGDRNWHRSKFQKFFYFISHIICCLIIFTKGIWKTCIWKGCSIKI